MKNEFDALTVTLNGPIGMQGFEGEYAIPSPEETVDISHSAPEKMKELVAELYAICDPEKESARAHEFQARQLKALVGMGLEA